jgi:hypothetical protein
VVAAKPQGEILVLSDHGDHTLRCPLPISLVATSAHGPWIVAASDGRLLLWDLDAIEPRLLTTRSPSSARFVTGNHVIVTYFDEPAEWIDLRKSSTVSLGTLAAIDSVTTTPGGDEAVIIDGARRAFRVAGVGQPQELDGEISAAAYVDDHRLVLAGAHGLRIEDSQQRTKLALYAHDAVARSLAATAADGGWIVAAFDDGVLWRKQLAASTTGELKLEQQRGTIPLALADDGTALFAAGGELRAWRPDGRVDVLAQGLTGVLSLALQGGTRVLVLAEAGARVIDLDRSAAPRPVNNEIELLGRPAALARSGGLVAAPTVAGGVEIVDPLVSWRWPLATPQKGQAPFSVVDIAPDGSRVLASNATEVFVWTLELPDDADATRSWLSRLTNATADNPSGPLGWP